MKVIFVLFLGMLGAGYASAHDENLKIKNSQEQNPLSLSLATDDQNASLWRHGRGWGWRGGWRGYGGWGYGGYYYGPSYGYFGYVEPVRSEPIYEEVRVPVVQRVPVVKDVVKVIRPEIHRVEVPITRQRTIVGSPVDAPAQAPAVLPQGGDNAQGPAQGPPPAQTQQPQMGGDMQGGGMQQQGPNAGGQAPAGGGGMQQQGPGASP
jgi:hypothetical protein